MYVSILAFAMALELPLLVAKKLFPAVSFLPLGGDDFNQAAILLMTAFFFIQVIEVMKEATRFGL